MSSLILIGMPGVGKTTIGRVASKKSSYPFYDIDALISKDTHQSISNTIKSIGIEAFHKLEAKVLKSLDLDQRSIISTGGSIIYSPEAMDYAKSQNSIICYLNQNPSVIRSQISNFETRGIINKNNLTWIDLFKERDPLYRKYATLVLNCMQKSKIQIADELIEILKNGLV